MTSFIYSSKINADTSADLNFNAYLIDASSNNVTLTLPTIDGDDITYILSRVDVSVNSNVVTIACSGGNTFYDSSTSITIPQNKAFTINSNGNIWFFLDYMN
jgi:hypothetical protein